MKVSPLNEASDKKFTSLFDGSNARIVVDNDWSNCTSPRNVLPETLKPFLATNSCAIFLFFYIMCLIILIFQVPPKILAFSNALLPFNSIPHEKLLVVPISTVDESLNCISVLDHTD